MKRIQEQYVIKDLSSKYVFLAGPRQSGKTTLAKQLFSSQDYQYLNYDLAEHRQIMVSGQWLREKKLIILDEFHKYPTWKTHLKGYYDTEGNTPSILVTGSARLNVYRKGNDSMVGRYFYHRLMPFSVKELEKQMPSQEALEALLEYGNFPEPLLKASKQALKRWQKQYLERVIREDVTDLSNIRDLPKIQLLIDVLRQRVGTTISYASIARDLEIAPKTCKQWIELLEQLYIVFRITPYHKNIARSLLKEPKIYFYDATMAFDESAHLENLVAVCLKKHLLFLEDTQGIETNLHYLRTKDQKEIDFVTLQDNKIEHMIEVKTSKDTYESAFSYFKKQITPHKCYQIVKNLKQPKTINDVNIIPAAQYLSRLSA
jgi:uncharacterized protein